MSSAHKIPPKTPSAPNNSKRGDGHSQMTLTRQDITLAIHDRCEGVSRREAKRLVDSIIGEIVSTLTAGESLKLHDFGSFVVRAKAERAGRNPRTGAAVPILPRRVVVFKASPKMKAVVNGSAGRRRPENAAGGTPSAAKSGAGRGTKAPQGRDTKSE